MRKNLIFTTHIYSEAFDFAKWTAYKMCLKSQELYAERIDADFYCQEERVMNLSENGNDEKLNIYNLLEKYQRVLSLDADILIKPDAPNIFDACRDRSVIYMLNETRQNHELIIKEMLPAIVKSKPNMAPIISELKRNYRYPDYFNVGVILASRERRDIFKIEGDYIEPMHWRADQDFVNYRIYRAMAKNNYVNDIAVCLPLSFNGMFVFNPNALNECFFIHYAGGHLSEIPNHFSRLFDITKYKDEFTFEEKDLLPRLMRPADNIRYGIKTMLWCMGRDSMVGVELGAYSGEGTETFVEKCRKLYAVDAWTDPEIESAFDTRADEHSERITKLKMSAAEAAGVIAGPLDFVYIDGITTGVELRSAVELFKDKVKPDGFMCGHDTYTPDILEMLRQIFGRIDGVKLQTFCDGTWLFHKAKKL